MPRRSGGSLASPRAGTRPEPDSRPGGQAAGGQAEAAVEPSRRFSTTGYSSSAISAWLWPARVRRPASLMMIWNTPASAIPCSLATAGGTGVVSLMTSASAEAWRSASSSTSRWTAGLMAAR